MAVKIYVVYYSLYGHEERLARELAKGVNSIDGVAATLWQVPETYSIAELHNLGASPKSNIQTITPNKLTQADGIIFLFRTSMAPPFKAFLDQCKTKHLAQKTAIIITSISLQGLPHEVPSNAIPTLINHRMIYVAVKMGVGTPTKTDPVMGKLTGNPTSELLFAFHTGSYFAAVTKTFKECAANR